MGGGEGLTRLFEMHLPCKVEFPMKPFRRHHVFVISLKNNICKLALCDSFLNMCSSLARLETETQLPSCI